MKISKMANKIRENRLSGKLSTPNQIPLSGTNPYSVQKDVAKSSGKVMAWKAGGTNEKTQKYFNTTDAYFGPIPKNVYSADKTINLTSESLLFPLKGEVEICFSLNENFNELGNAPDLADVVSAIDKVHLGLEMPWTQFNQPESGLDYLIADLCGANALLVGSGVEYEHWQKVTGDTLRLTCGNQELTSGNVQDSIIGPLETLSKFAQFCREQQISIPANTFLATGGVTQCVAIDTDSQLRISSSHLPSLNIMIASRGNSV